MPGEYGYCNVKWQLLTEYFRRTTGVNCSDVVRIGRWETDATGTCLGPHGLYLTHDEAIELGTLAHQHLAPPQNYCRSVDGWWVRADRSMVASGYNYQWIWISADGRVAVRLNGLLTDFDGPASPHPPPEAISSPHPSPPK